MPALQLTADDHLSRRIDAVDLKHRLGDVETDCRDRLHAWLPHNRDRPSGDHFNGTYVPIGEPSTASKAEPWKECPRARLGLAEHRKDCTQAAMLSTRTAAKTIVPRMYRELQNGGVASHRRKYRLDPDIDHCGGRFGCLLGEQAIKAYPARKVS